MTRRTAAVDSAPHWAGLGARTRLAVERPLRALGLRVDRLAAANFSIRTKILLSLAIVILLMSVPNALMLLNWLRYSSQYDAIINNITAANSLGRQLKPDLDTEMWKVVSGKIEFADGNQYRILEETDAQLREMIAVAGTHRAEIKLDLVRRTLQTLREDVDRMGSRIAASSTASENEAILEQIRFDTTILQEVIQDYALFEVQRIERQYLQMQQSIARWQFLNFLLMVGAVLFSVLAAWGISRSIYLPIKKLHDVTSTVTRSDLQALMSSDNVDEIAELGMSFNIMIGKVRDLVDSKLKEHEELRKAEFRALQAQINPHFLYNTLDTIIWMAEAGRTNEVVDIVQALSSFFRLNLSKGRDWISVAEELERTRNYLTIQKMRYRDILDFRLEAEPEVLGESVPKLSLQPLVENALYHGIKNKRDGGVITVRARRDGGDRVVLEVEDDGAGISPERLDRIRATLEDESDEIRTQRGYGLDNVNKRIRLYYGRAYGLAIESEEGTGTRVSLVVPAVAANGAGPSEGDSP